MNLPVRHGDIPAWLDHVSMHWWPATVHGTWQASLVGLVVLVLVHSRFRWSSSLKHALLVLALLKFATPAFWTAPTGVFSWLPPLRPTPPDSPTLRTDDIRFAQPQTGRGSSFQIQEDRLVPDIGTRSPQNSQTRTSQAKLANVSQDPNPRSSVDRTSSVGALIPPNLRVVLMTLHGLGTVLALGWTSWQLVLFRRMVRTPGVPVSQYPQLTTLLEQAARDVGLTCRPRLKVVRDSLFPMAAGLWNPIIVLPAVLVERLAPSALRTVLAHELAHHRRKDLWIHWLVLILRCVWWFNPVFWMLSRAIRRIREDCCDDLLLARGVTDRDRYCRTLLDAAGELARFQTSSNMVGLALGDRGHPLRQRMTRIMQSPPVPHMGITTPGLLVLTAFTALALPGLRITEGTSPKPQVAPLTTAGAPEISNRTPAELLERLGTIQTPLSRSQLAVMIELRRRVPEVVRLQSRELSNVLRRWSVFPADSEDERVFQFHQEGLFHLRVLEELGSAASEALPTVIQALDNPWLLRNAARTLKAMGSAASNAIPALCSKLDPTNPHSGALAQTLAAIAPDSREILNALTRLATDPRLEPEASLDLCSALGRLSLDPEKREALLLDLARSPGIPSPETITYTLQFMGARSPAARALITEHLRLRFERDAHPSAPPVRAEDLRQAIANAAPPQPIRRRYDGGTDLLRTIFRADAGDPDCVPLLIPLLASTNLSLRHASLMALRRFGPTAETAVPHLLLLLGHEDISLSIGAMGVLGSIGEASRPALPPIEELFSRSLDARERLAAAFCLRRIDPQSTSKMLPSLLAWIASAANGDPDPEWLGAATLLREIGPPAAAALPLLGQIASGPNPRWHWLAWRAIGAIAPGELQPQVPQLIRMVTGDALAPDVVTAAEILGELPAATESVIAALKEAAQSTNPYLSRAASTALARHARNPTP